jgi:phage shock protein PspC (stress-responsive transcriptional regulator)
MLMNRRLYRSRSDTILAGVAAGVANYLNADPALIRIAWAILVPLTGGAALLAYIVAWVVVPEAPAGSRLADAASVDESRAASFPTETGEEPIHEEPGRRASDGGGSGLVVGLILIGIGVWFLVREYLPQLDWSLIWPIVLIAIGGLVLVTSSRRRTG